MIFMKTFNSFLATEITKPIKKVYHYLFEYDEDRLSIYGQFCGKILAYLSYALLHRAYVLLTYQDGSTEIGQITKRLSAGRFVLRSEDKKILKIVDLNDIFRVDLS